MNYIESYLVVSSILFTFGIFAVITRKNAVAILMGIELILNSANVNFIAFNRFGNFNVLDGHVFSIFVVVHSKVAFLLHWINFSRNGNNLNFINYFWSTRY